MGATVRESKVCESRVQMVRGGCELSRSGIAVLELWAQGRGGVASFPAQQRDPADPAVVARGRAVYDTECRSCHGPDLRGGERGGSEPASVDAHAERSRWRAAAAGRFRARTRSACRPAGLTPDDVKAVAAYIHSILALAPGQGAPPPGPPVELKVLVGDAAAGAAIFRGEVRELSLRDWRSQGHRCARSRSCSTAESVDCRRAGTEDAAAAVRARCQLPPMTTRREATVVVTLPTGQKYEGRLERIDDFIVSLTQADGTPRSFRRNGDVPKVDVRDPLEAHRELLPIYTDKDIHDVTAYLASLK